MCDEWLDSFDSFYEWCKPIFFEGAYIDRIDPNGNYEPGNCRFVTTTESANNKRSNHQLEYKGTIHTISELVLHEDCKVKYSTLHNRITNLGWDVESAMSGAYSKYKKSNAINKKSKVVLYQGREYSLIGLCRELGIENKYDTVKMRLNKLNWNIEKSILFT